MFVEQFTTALYAAQPIRIKDQNYPYYKWKLEIRQRPMCSSVVFSLCKACNKQLAVQNIYECELGYRMRLSLR